MSAMGGHSRVADQCPLLGAKRTSAHLVCSGGEGSEENAFTGCSKRQQIVCRQKPKHIAHGLRCSSRLYVGPQRSALDYIAG